MTFISEFSNGRYVYEPDGNRVNELGFEVRGRLSPFIEISLKTGEGLVCDKQAILQHDFGLTVRPWPGLGDSRWLVVNASDEAELAVMLTARETGMAGAFNLSDYNGKLICPLASLMANGPGIVAGFYARFQQQGISLVLLEGNGWAFLRSCGDVFQYQMFPGEQICVRAHAVAAMTATVDFDPAHPICRMHDENGEMQFALLSGPGTIWLQSSYLVPQQQKPARITHTYPQVHDLALGELAIQAGSGA